VIEYIEVTLADITLANRIAHDVLGRSLDELPPQTRRLVKLIDGYVAQQCKTLGIGRTEYRFSRRALREAIAWGDTQLKVHLARLVELEYLIAHRTKANGLDYELVYEAGAGDDTLRLPGLADVEALAHGYDRERSGQNTARSAPGRGAVGARSAPGRDDGSPAEQASTRVGAETTTASAETHFYRPNGKDASHPQIAAA
jgi:hypothetical protein